MVHFYFPSLSGHFTTLKIACIQTIICKISNQQYLCSFVILSLFFFVCFQAARLPWKLSLCEFIFSCCFSFTSNQPPLLQRACANDPSHKREYKRKNEKAIITLMKWTREVLDWKSSRLWVVALLPFEYLFCSLPMLLPGAWVIQEHKLVDTASRR